MLLQAIVAPGLSHFDASLRDVASLFREIPSVFNEVHHLCLRASTMCSVTGVCQAFPNVRQFEMEQLASMSFRYLQEDTDLWGGIEHVTFRSLHVKRLQEAVAGFAEWIQLRKPMAKPLHVRFIDIKRCSSWNETGRLLSMLYNSLHEDCTFEIDQFPLIEQTRVTLLNRALHMNLPHVPPCVVNMRSGKDIPWHKSMEDFQNVSEDEFSDSEEEDSEEERRNVKCLGTLRHRQFYQR
ncbi:hypothetical protein EDC04DRAFT_1035207 [Pisolithus marmoratus]|nr:hypothetical protein EDC04DRAFT_1035207 [Pisolithus marmoratus]